jgi:biotin transport system permease protein
VTPSLYIPGTSPLHRAPTWSKLAALAALGVGLFAASRIEVAAGALAVVVTTGLLVAGLPVRALTEQVRPVGIWLTAVFGVHLVMRQPAVGAESVLRLLTLVVTAAVVTSTTRVTALVAVVEWLARPLQLLGVRPARVGLVIAMALRFIPLLGERAARIRQARAARGSDRGQLLMLVPLLIQALRMAHALGEALDARGADAAPARWPRRRDGGQDGRRLEDGGAAPRDPADEAAGRTGGGTMTQPTSEQSASKVDSPTSESRPEPEDVVTGEMLVEEVSIDGMCGVY